MCAATWADPHIVVDNTGMLHVSYTGVARDATGRDIFYSRNDGAGWTPSVRVTSDTAHNYNEWYSDIAADRPDNVWVVWNRQGEGPDQFRVYACHYDGDVWSQEERLDNDSAYYDVDTDLTLDSSGSPWVTWSGTLYGGGYGVFYNRYDAAGIEEPAAQAQAARTLSLAAPSPCAQPVTIRYVLPAAGNVSLEFYDNLGRKMGTPVKDRQAAGQHTAQWPLGNEDGGSIAPGIYFCRLKAAGIDETCSFVLMGRR